MRTRWLPRAVALVVLISSGARGQEWDHDANIESAVEALVAVFRGGGMDAAQTFVGDCYKTIDGFENPDQRLQRLEYCAGMDFAGYLVKRQSQATDAEGAAFFAPDAMFQRMQRLDQWVEDPASNHQILRAWAGAAAGALLALQQR